MAIPYGKITTNPDIRRIFENCVEPVVDDFFNAYDIVPEGNIELVHQYSHLESLAMHTLVINTYQEESSSWTVCAQGIEQLFWTNGAKHYAQNIQVEIRNPKRMYCDVSRALPNDKDLARGLEAVQPEVAKCIERMIPALWSSIAYHWRANLIAAQSEETSPGKPTIIVFCKPGSSYNFEMAETLLMGLLAGMESHEVYVEFLPGKVMDCRPAPTDPSKPVRLRNFTAKPRNGASISPKGNADSIGTLGGWVRLRFDGPEKKTIKCAMTCYHVIQPRNIDIRQSTDLGIIHEKKHGHDDVMYPAPRDVKFTVFDDKKNDNTEEQYAMLNHAKRHPTSIGKVLYASGFREVWTGERHHRVDWALIESPSTFTTNLPTPHDGFRPKKDDGDKYEDDDRFPRPPDEMPDNPGKAYEETVTKEVRNSLPRDKVAEGGLVFMSGRTTEHTWGEINKLRQNVSWGEYPKNVKTDEWEIISKYEDPVGPGDSGSFVTNEKGKLMGLIFAQQTGSGEYTNAYMTTFDDINDDVTRITKGGYLEIP